jgi:hypothetical protein
MSEPIIINVADLVGGPRAVDAADGEKVFEKMLPVIESGRKVRLSFNGITMVITAFLNASIGRLYGVLPEDQVDTMLEVKDLLEPFQTSLEKSIEWSKAYYREPDRLDKAIKEELGDEE